MPGARELLVQHERAATQRLERLGHGASAPRLAALLETGRLRRALGHEEAGAALRAAVALSEQLHDALAGRAAIAELGGWLAGRGDAVGRAYLERAVDLASRAHDALAARDLAVAAAELAVARALSSDREGAEAALSLAATAAGETPALVARVALRRADAARVLGDARAARAAYASARETAAASVLDPADAAAIELGAAAGLERLAVAAPTARELVELGAIDLAALVDAGVRIARAAGAERLRIVVEAACAVTGAAGARLVIGGRLVATAGAVGEDAPAVWIGDRGLAFAPPQGATFGAREELIARALLAHVEGGAEARGADPTRVLGMLDRVLAAGLDLDRVVAVATDLAVEATGAARGLILLREPGARLGYRAARASGSDLEDPEAIVSRSLVREAFLSGRALLLADAAGDPRLAKAESVGARGLRSVLVAPILDEDGTTAIGVLYLDEPGIVAHFGPGERDLAVGFAGRLGPPLRAVLERERERAAAASALAALSMASARPATKHAYAEIVGRSRAVGSLLELLDRAVESSVPVLVVGESGTGKELVARALHANGARARGPFVALSCAALADTVLENELFGHVRGAFSGATSDHKGAFEQAHGGTLLLDELHEASPKLQAELLRVLETGEVRPIGAGAVRKVDVRLVAAASTGLPALVAAGRFREDLLYRVNVLRVSLTPLRERREDIPDLVTHFLARLGERRLGPGALEKLLGAPWPGNVRALRNCIERAATLAGSGPILAEHVVFEAPSLAAPARVPAALPPGAVYAGSIELNERQLALIDRLRAEGEISNADYTELEKISQPTGWRDLNELVSKGVLVKIGRGKKTVYRLAPNWERRMLGSS